MRLCTVFYSLYIVVSDLDKLLGISDQHLRRSVSIITASDRRGGCLVAYLVRLIITPASMYSSCCCLTFSQRVGGMSSWLLLTCTYNVYLPNDYNTTFQPSPVSFSEGTTPD